MKSSRLFLMRLFLIDTLAQIIFSTAVGALVETLIAGLSIGQMIGTRISAIPVILLAGRPYGLYRDWLFQTMRASVESQFKATTVDTIANVTFQAPIYAILLALNSANVGQIVSAVGSVIIISAVSGRPYGIFLTWCRRTL